MAPRQEKEEAPQRRWWEEGCYCPRNRCICGTEEDPFRVQRGEGDE